MRISVIGAGYLGAVHAACMADLGHEVVAVDVDRERIDALNAGRPPIYEPGLEELLERVLAPRRLRFTTEYAEARDCALHFVCVGTPQRPDSNAADTGAVFSAVSALVPHLRRDSLVVGKSTVPVGTAHQLRELLRDTTERGRDVRLAWNPEFLREGFAITDTIAPNRLVYGVDDASRERDVALLDEVYAAPITQGTPRFVMDYATSELVKVSANAFLATKISFINAMAEVCESAGGDVVQLADAIGVDDRIGRRFLGPGLGFGGGCLPKDIRAFMARADEIGAVDALAFLSEVDAINQRRRARMVDMAREECGGRVDGRVVAVLGAAFKPDTDDVRDSPALEVARALHQEGAHVVVHDPRALDAVRALAPELGHAESAIDACRGADVVLHLTEWADYRDLDPAELKTVVSSAGVIDGRNALPVEAWKAAGWRYRALGRATVCEDETRAGTRRGPREWASRVGAPSRTQVR